MNVLLLALFLTCFPFAKWEQGGGWEYGGDGSITVEVDGNDDRAIEWVSDYPICRTDVKAGDGNAPDRGVTSTVYDPPVYEGVASDPDHGISHITFYREDSPTAITLSDMTVSRGDKTWPDVVYYLGLFCFFVVLILAMLGAVVVIVINR